jgi:glutaminase
MMLTKLMRLFYLLDIVFFFGLISKTLCIEQSQAQTSLVFVSKRTWKRMKLKKNKLKSLEEIEVKVQTKSEGYMAILLIILKSLPRILTLKSVYGIYNQVWALSRPLYELFIIGKYLLNKAQSPLRARQAKTQKNVDLIHALDHLITKGRYVKRLTL